MAFTKQDLLFVHYRWGANLDEPVASFDGEPTRRAFDRFNGAQVLFIINYFSSMNGSSDIQSAQAVESMIAHRLPLDLKSERSVFNWLVEVMKSPEAKWH